MTEILDWTERNFGTLAADRYAALLIRCFLDLAEDPLRIGSKGSPIEAEAWRVYHIRHSRKRVADPPGLVGQPRHVVVYEVGSDGIVDILGVHHDGVPRDVAMRAILSDP